MKLDKETETQIGEVISCNSTGRWGGWQEYVPCLVQITFEAEIIQREKWRGRNPFVTYKQLSTSARPPMSLTTRLQKGTPLNFSGPGMPYSALESPIDMEVH